MIKKINLTILKIKVNKSKNLVINKKIQEAIKEHNLLKNVKCFSILMIIRKTAQINIKTNPKKININ